MTATSTPTIPSGLLSSSSPPPKNIENWRMFAIAAIAAPIMAAIVVTRMSRLATCAISCASTPFTCSRGR